jgi:aconitate hydratase
MRGTFANVCLRNELVPGKEGGWTAHLPDGEEMTIFDASNRYQNEGIPLLVIAGKEYGSGSSRDWAAKGPRLLGIRAVIAESFERIHRSNLVAMGVLPLQFVQGASRQSLQLSGRERFSIGWLANLRPNQQVTVRAIPEDGSARTFTVTARVDNDVELEYLRWKGILPMMLDRLLRALRP